MWLNWKTISSSSKSNALWGKITNLLKVLTLFWTLWVGWFYWMNWDFRLWKSKSIAVNSPSCSKPIDPRIVKLNQKAVERILNWEEAEIEAIYKKLDFSISCKVHWVLESWVRNKGNLWALIVEKRAINALNEALPWNKYVERLNEALEKAQEKMST